MISYILLSSMRRAQPILLGSIQKSLGSAKRTLSSAPFPHNQIAKPIVVHPLSEGGISPSDINFRLNTETNTSLSIPQLPVQESLRQTYLGEQVAELAKQENPYAVFTIHGFKTNASLIEFFIKNLNFDPQKIHVVDKFYSTSPHWRIFMRQLGVNYYEVPAPQILGGYNAVFSHTLKKMWKEVRAQVLQDRNPFPKIIALSDGGDLLKLTPPDLRVLRMGGVEQTTAGVKKINEVLYPVAEVASSAAKKFLESYLIAEDIFLHVSPYLKKENFPSTKTCGIIGNGVIGTALARYLIKLGFNVWVYDSNPNAFDKVRNNVIVCNSINTLLENCDYAFGCTGEDVFALNNIDADQFILKREKDLTLFSCSSSMREWQTPIDAIRRNTDTGRGRLDIPPMSDVNYISLQDARVTVANMGYPINFNRQEETIPPHLMDLTRSLMTLGGMLVYPRARSPIADGYTVNQPERLPIDAELQKYVVQSWLKNNPSLSFPHELIQHFNDEQWIAENSQPKQNSNCPYPPFSSSKTYVS